MSTPTTPKKNGSEKGGIDRAASERVTAPARRRASTCWPAHPGRGADHPARLHRRLPQMWSTCRWSGRRTSPDPRHGTRVDIGLVVQRSTSDRRPPIEDLSTIGWRPGW